MTHSTHFFFTNPKLHRWFCLQQIGTWLLFGFFVFVYRGVGGGVVWVVCFLGGIVSQLAFFFAKFLYNSMKKFSLLSLLTPLDTNRFFRTPSAYVLSNVWTTESSVSASSVSIISLFLIYAISRSSQYYTTGITKDVVCIILSVGWCI